MIMRLGNSVGLAEGKGPSLAHIFQPVRSDLRLLEERLAALLHQTVDPAVREITDYLLETPGKWIRPTLVLLSARAAGANGNGSCGLRRASLDVAAAVELIHMASLIHDDLLDGAIIRHHRDSVPAKWGKRISVSIGDHLCAKAFQVVADCADPRLFAILGPQLCAMCEGEIQQVVGRGDFELSERHCLAMAEKKTAALFGACCGAGAATAVDDPRICQALQQFGVHFGVAFQILDDCRDFLSDQAKLGKTPGQDLLAGDVTLPLLCAMHSSGWESRLGNPRAIDAQEIAQLGDAFRNSPAPRKLVHLIDSYVAQAQGELDRLVPSDAQASLRRLADHIAVAASEVLAR